MSLAKGSKKTLVIVALLLLLFGLGLFVFLEKTHRTDLVKKPSTVQSAKEETKAAEEKKQTYLDESPPTTINGSGETVSQTNYTPPTNSDNILLEAKREGSNVVLLTQLKGYSDGKCVLNIAGPDSYSGEADVMYQTSYATCAGFSVPISAVGQGTWQINLKVISGGVTNEKTISLEVK